MDHNNNASRIKKKLLIEVAKMAMDKTITENVDQIPVKFYPKNSSSIRCCVHKDRSVTKYRLQAILGHRIEDEIDETKLLSEYTREAYERKEINSPVLTVITDACSACLKGRHFVTNVCRGCVARPCLVNCPKDAIQMVDGHAKIDEDLCVDCGKCIKVCPFHAIVFVPVPCEEACPVKAISKDDSGFEGIDYDKCMYCGKCIEACPFGAIMERSQIVDVIKTLQNKKNRNVVAMLAPALAGQFPYPFEKIFSAVRMLGFDNVYEVAAGAHETAANEAKEFKERLQNKQSFMTTSCCTAYVNLVNKHIPQLKEYVSDTPTPMQYTAKMIHKEIENPVTVFISPCPSKRVEAIDTKTVDYIISAEEFGALLVAADIEIDECTPSKADTNSDAFGKLFSVSGGVTNSVQACLHETCDIKPVVINGINKKTVALLKAYSKGKCPGNFLEVMSCEGGCVGGPDSLEKSEKAKVRIEKYAKDSERGVG